MKLATCFLVVATTSLSFLKPESAIAQPQPVAARPIAIEVTLVRTSWGPADERAASLSGNSSEVASRLHEWESAGEVLEIERVSLTALENLPTKIQSGKNVPVSVGRTGGPRGGEAVRYQQQNVGTIVTAMARGDRDAVVAEVSVETSQLEQRETASQNDESETPFVPTGTETLSAQSTVRIENGKTILATALQNREGTTATSQFLLVSARILESSIKAEPTEVKSSGDARRLQVYKLQHAAAQEAANLIDKLHLADASDLKVVPDVRTNAIIVSASSSNVFESIDAIVQKLDEKKDKVDKGDKEGADAGRASSSETSPQPRAEDSSKYDAMNDQELVELIKKLHVETQEAERLARHALTNYQQALQAYQSTSDDQKLETLFRMMEADAARVLPRKAHSEAAHYLEAVKGAYLKRLIDKQK